MSQAATDLPTVRALLREATRVLPAQDARLEAEILLAFALDVSRAWLYAHADDSIDAARVECYRALLADRAAGRPVAYLTGVREFWSLPLQVTRDTLIPRTDTELLVEQALLHIPQSGIVDILDLGTGSGAIALAIASERPNARVVATDISVAALEVARANAQRLQLRNIMFLESAWFDAIDQQRFDVIVSNPPYIADKDEHLSQGDLRFEPMGALASGSDGLDAIREIVGGAPTRLKNGGWLLLEHGHDQGHAVRALLASAEVADVVTAADMEGRERVSMGRK